MPFGPPPSVLKFVKPESTPREEFHDLHRAKGLPGWRIGQLWDALSSRARRLARGGKDARVEAARRQREKDRG